jgi:hypothetical protein
MTKQGAVIEAGRRLKLNRYNMAILSDKQNLPGDSQEVIPLGGEEEQIAEFMGMLKRVIDLKNKSRN